MKPPEVVFFLFFNSRQVSVSQFYAARMISQLFLPPLTFLVARRHTAQDCVCRLSALIHTWLLLSQMRSAALHRSSLRGQGDLESF